MSTKISQLTSATDITASDLMQIVDVEDGVMAPSGTNKKITAQLLADDLAGIVSDGSIATSKLASGALPSGVTVSSTNIVNGTIVDADINASAAIAGSKISPSFTAPSVISVDSSSDALRITQTGSGNALVVEDSTNPDATPFVVNDQGQLLIGNSTSLVGPFGFSRGLQVTNQGAQFNSFNANQYGEGIAFVKTRGTPSSPHTIVQLNDALGSVSFSGSDGSGYVLGSQITSFVDQVPGANDMPTCLTFATTPDGSTTCTERMRITSAGNVGIGTSTPVDKLSVNGPIHIVPATTNSGAFVDEANRTNTYLSLQGSAGQTDFAYLRQIGTGDNDLTISLDLHDDANDPSGGQAFAIRNVPSSVHPDSTPITNFIVNGNGNVGIGTATPSVKLDVSGFIRSMGRSIIDGAAATFRFLSFKTNDSERWHLGVNDDGESGSNAGSNFFLHRFSDAGAFLERVLHISRATGNVGIGTSSPVDKLSVNGPIHIVPATTNSGASVDEANRTNTYLSLQGSAGQTDFAYLRQIGTGDNDLTISLDLHDDANHPSGGQAFAIRNVPSSAHPDSTPITNFIVNGNGNVGIGTSSPVSKLHLTSSDPSWGSGLTLENTAASRKFALSTRSDLSSPARFSISDETAFQERVSLLGSNGNLGIGEFNPSSKLHVAGDITMSSATTSPSATAGTNGAIPAQVGGYLVTNINGTSVKIPYYPA